MDKKKDKERTKASSMDGRTKEMEPRTRNSMDEQPPSSERALPETQLGQVGSRGSVFDESKLPYIPKSQISSKGHRRTRSGSGLDGQEFPSSTPVASGRSTQQPQGATAPANSADTVSSASLPARKAYVSRKTKETQVSVLIYPFLENSFSK